MFETDDLKFYDAQLKPCPFCGSAEQHVLGVRISGGWRWTVRCMGCSSVTGDKETEQGALNLWNRKTRKEAEANDEDYDRWCACRQRYVNALTGRIESR